MRRFAEIPRMRAANGNVERQEISMGGSCVARCDCSQVCRNRCACTAYGVTACTMTKCIFVLILITTDVDS